MNRENTIATYANTRKIIDKYELVLKKRFGQNFLVDPFVLQKIINGCEIENGDLVIEVGPGIGGLTQALSEKAKKIIAIEIDNKLADILNETFSGCEKVSVVNSDVLDVSFNDLVENSGFKKAKICANLPYYITTPIIMKALESGVFSKMVIMVQKEVGERLKAKPGTKEYGSLTLAVNYFCDVSVVANVPQNCFIPRPNVDSIVLKLDILEKPRVMVKNPDFMFHIIKVAFSTRRKTLLNCFFNDQTLKTFVKTKEEIIEWMRISGLSETIRGEELFLSDFALLSENFMYNVNI